MTSVTGENCSGTVQQPRWIEPCPPEESLPELRVYNSLTRSKVPFKPAEGKLIRWYSCGPTVYDAAHIGHARNYITFDIIRRILRDYFNYDITYVMNITDIDDKIILKARRGHLVEQFALKHQATRLEDLQKELFETWTVFVQDKFGFAEAEDFNAWVLFSSRMRSELDAKAGSWSEAEAKKSTALDVAMRARQELETGLPTDPMRKAWLVEGHFAEILSPWLDAQFGATVTDQKIYRDLAAFWEADFLEDMAALNVLPVDYMTRVSEYVPEIIEFVQRIIGNGFAYESEGSVYFDVAAYDRHPTHSYAKLCPWSAGNAKFFEEGEGSLGVKLQGKRDARDFALWKCSKPGEPFWPSPWGRGRPGWHIECSAMAASVLPQTLDIHSGGIDLAFPHHDNEIAQAEAHYHSEQWVNYFLHAGHVHIEGLKMSKSLKNFISIKEALQRYSARQLRILFLQHGWGATLIYKESSMQAAAAVEGTFSNFFSTVQALLREKQKQKLSTEPRISPTTGLLQNDHGVEEAALLTELDSTRKAVHAALCDSFDTPSALNAILSLINRCNVYLKQRGAEASAQSLAHVLRYVDKMYRIFGLQKEGDNADTSQESAEFVNASRLLSILEKVSGFRDAVRSTALAELKTQSGSSSASKALLTACDSLRRELAPFGIVFEDRSGAGETATLVRLVDPSTVSPAAANEKTASADPEAERKRLELLKLKEERAATKARKAAIPPELLFRQTETAVLYSQFDERGIPTHDSSGLELSKNARKKAVKEYEGQAELHQQFLAGTLH